MENKKTLEAALAEMEANKKQLADYQKEFAADIEAENAKRSAWNARLAALSYEERRKVLDAAGMKYMSAAPTPISPLRGSSYIPPKPIPTTSQIAPEAPGINGDETENLLPPASQPKKAAEGIKQTKNVWTEANLRTLYHESIMPGATPDKLAAKYGISRQGIEKQIKNAGDLFKVGGKPKPASSSWKSGK